jgi:tRNA U34 5-methylaminomethyl-2-thiouridine-forming methyltransferase MnmC
VEIIVTKDGSHSLLNTEMNETYHSVHGAWRESEYVFIQKGLQFFLENSPKKEVSILEVGFGTGLNALLTLRFAQEKQQRIHYTTLEAYPLEKDVWSKLNYGETLGNNSLYVTLHQTPWNEAVMLEETFTLHKKHQKLEETTFSRSFDIVYFDAFAPSKQPEMWTIENLDRVVRTLNPGGVFVTYCAKGQLKRDLKSLSLDVETLPGPPGKKEMVRARQKLG